MKPLLILCPLGLELKTLVAELQNLGHAFERRQLGPLSVYDFPSLSFFCSLGGHGKTQFAVQTRFLLDQLPQVKSVICAGTAGALDAEIQPGDLFVGETTIEHDYRLKFISKPEPEFPADKDLIALARKPVKDLRVHFGRLASGDEDIVESDRALALAKQTGAKAVAWEGAGAARACALTKTPFLEVRGISDSADDLTPENFKINAQQVMKDLSKMLVDCFGA